MTLQRRTIDRIALAGFTIGTLALATAGAAALSTALERHGETVRAAQTAENAADALVSQGEGGSAYKPLTALTLAELAGYRAGICAVLTIDPDPAAQIPTIRADLGIDTADAWRLIESADCR